MSISRYSRVTSSALPATATPAPAAPARVVPQLVPRHVPQLAPQIAALLVALLATLLLGACADSSPPPPSSIQENAGQDTGTSGSVAPAGEDAAGAGRSEELDGRLVWIEVPDGHVDNVASALDLATGEITELWSTGVRTNISDVSLSPDGSRIAYRVVEHDGSPPEAVVVRRLEQGAEPVIIAATETDVGRLTGFAWAPDGTGIAYGRQLGHLRVNEDGASPFDLWELHLATEGAGDAAAGYMTDDTTVWSIEGSELGPVALDVVGWAPEDGVVAVTETAADGGASEFVRLVDTDSDEVRGRVPAGALQFDAIGSPDGRYVAMPDATVGSGLIRVLDVSTGEVFDVSAAAHSTPGAPVWSADSAWLGWTTHGCGNAASGAGDCTVGAVSVKEAASGASGPAFELTVGDENTRALGFDPDGSRLLVAEAIPGDRAWDHVAGHALDGSDDVLPVPWQPPQGAWFAAWVP